jgi:chromosome segregation ATPase
MYSNGYNLFECRCGVRKKCGEVNESLASEIEETRDVKERLQERDKKDIAGRIEYGDIKIKMSYMVENIKDVFNQLLTEIKEKLLSEITQLKDEQFNLSERDMENKIKRAIFETLKDTFHSAIEEGESLKVINKNLEAETEKKKYETERLHNRSNGTSALETEYDDKILSVTKQEDLLNSELQKSQYQKQVNETLVSEMDQLKDEYKRLHERENELKVLRFDCDNMDRKMTELVEQLRCVCRENESLKEANDRLRSETDEVTNKLQSLREVDKEAILLSNQREGIKACITELMDDISLEEQVKARLNGVKESLASRTNELKGEIENPRERENKTEALRTECDNLKRDITQLDENRSRAIRENEYLKEEQKRLESENDKRKDELHRLRERYTETNSLKTQYEDMNVRKSALVADIYRAQQEGALLRDANKWLASINRNLKEETENLRERENKTEALRTECDNLKRDMTQLAENLSRAIREIECLKEEQKRLASENDEIKDELHRLQEGDEEGTSLKTKYERIRVRLNGLEMEISHEQREGQRLIDIEKELIAEIEELRVEAEKLHERENKSKALRIDRENMKTNTAYLIEERRSVVSENEHLSKGNEILSSEILDLNDEIRVFRERDIEARMNSKYSSPEYRIPQQPTTEEQGLERPSAQQHSPDENIQEQHTPEHNASEQPSTKQPSRQPGEQSSSVKKNRARIIQAQNYHCENIQAEESPDYFFSENASPSQKGAVQRRTIHSIIVQHTDAQTSTDQPTTPQNLDQNSLDKSQRDYNYFYNSAEAQTITNSTSAQNSEVPNNLSQSSPHHIEGAQNQLAKNRQAQNTASKTQPTEILCRNPKRKISQSTITQPTRACNLAVQGTTEQFISPQLRSYQTRATETNRLSTAQPRPGKSKGEITCSAQKISARYSFTQKSLAGYSPSQNSPGDKTMSKNKTGHTTAANPRTAQNKLGHNIKSQPRTTETRAPQTQTSRLTTGQPTTSQTKTVPPTAGQPRTSQTQTARPTTIQPTTSQTKTVPPTADQPRTSQTQTARPTTIQPTTSQTKTVPPTTGQPRTSHNQRALQTKGQPRDKIWKP